MPRRYQVLATADLNSGPWTPVGDPMTATDLWTQQIISADSIMGKQVFYRVQEVQP